jgi:hypothetical protein
MAARGRPGVERYFDWSFYSQGSGGSRQTSSDQFIQQALTFLDDPDPTKGSPWERGERLAGLVRRHRTLLVLDGIEPLQYPPNDQVQAGRLKDQALEALLQGLAADNSIAVDHLTLARVGLVRAILSNPLPQPTLDLPHVADAVNGLRDAWTIDYLPRALLTAAMYEAVRGDAAAARAALDHAQEIAERGPMPLYLADIHLHRATLFRDKAELAKARDLIEKHDYGRRQDELADAEAAL